MGEVKTSMPEFRERKEKHMKYSLLLDHFLGKTDRVQTAGAGSIIGLDFNRSSL